MKKFRSSTAPIRRMCALLLIAGFVSACGSSGGESSTGQVEAAIATDAQAAGWRPATKVRRYEGEALFDYIPTDWDVFLEYGCESIRVQDYESTNGDRARVELLDVASSDGAYGLFSLKTEPGGELIDVGDQGWRERGKINFWRARTQVTVRRLGTPRGSTENLLALATVVDQGLSGSAAPPRIIDLLPRKGLLPKGVTYMRGPAAARLIMRDWPWKFPEPVGGVRGQYAGGDGHHQLTVFEYSEPEVARAIAKEVLPAGTDRQGRQLIAGLPLGKYVFVFLGPPDPERAKEVMSLAVAGFNAFFKTGAGSGEPGQPSGDAPTESSGETSTGSR